MKWKLILIIMGIGVLIVGGLFALNKMETVNLLPETELGVVSASSYNQSDTKLLGIYCDSSYDLVNKIMTDTSCLNYDLSSTDFSVEGRKFSFAVGVNENYYELTDSIIKRLDRGKYDEFLSDYYIDGVNLTQSLNFSEDKSVPMKIYHSIENTNPTALENVTFYYVFEISNYDSIEVNGSLCDWKGNCEIQDYIDRPIVNFNSEYDFKYDDLTDNGFIFSDIRWVKKKLWLGFSKGDGSINAGTTIELDPTLSANDIESVAIAPLDEDKVIMGVCDETLDYVVAYVYFTNGTAIGSPIVIDADIGTCDVDDNLIAITPLNTSWWVLAYFDDAVDDIFFVTYDTTTEIKSAVTVDGAVGTDGRVDVDAINDTSFWLAYFDDAVNDIFYAKYQFDGTILTSPTTIDGQMNDEGDADIVGIATLNSTDCVIAWHDDDGDEVSFIIPAVGTKVAIETTAGSSQVSVTAFNSTHFVVGFFDQEADDMNFNVIAFPNTWVSGIRINDNNIGGTSTAVSEDIAIINSTHFVQSWYDDDDGDTTFAIAPFVGIPVFSLTDASQITTIKGSAVASEVHSSGVGLCNDTIAIMYIDTGSSTKWGTYYSNGSAWGGGCGPIVDVASPQWFDNSTNGTVAGTYIEHSVRWTDTALDGYIFSFDNGTGTFTNDSWVSMTGTNNWSNVSKTVNSTVGSTIQWIVYANDTAGNSFDATDTFTYDTTSANTCTCPSINTNWAIALSDYCVISATCDLGTGNVTFTATGNITFNATITALDYDDLPENQRGYVTPNARILYT